MPVLTPLALALGSRNGPTKFALDQFRLLHDHSSLAKPYHAKFYGTLNPAMNPLAFLLGSIDKMSPAVPSFEMLKLTSPLPSVMK